jgi:ADP-heptose:LPS heptosyltransferase
LKKRFETVDKIKVPVGGCKYVKHRRYIRYEARETDLRKWKHIPKNAVTFCVRGRNFGTHKNWSPKNWRRLIDHVMGQGFTPVITGIKELISIDLPDGCIDVQDQTTLGDLIAIMQKSKFAIGGSTGPLHLASLSGVPHAVWGSPRIKDRYLKSWNPHRAKVEYQACASGGFDIPLKEALKLADRMIERVA